MWVASIERNCSQKRLVLVLAIFTQRILIPDFLTLPDSSRQFHSKRLQFRSQLGWRLKLDARHPETLSGFHVGCNVINVKSFLGADFNSAQRFTVDQRIGLADAH